MAFNIYFDSGLSSNSQAALTLLKTKSLGEKQQEKVIYSPYEAFYLIEKKLAQLNYKDKQLGESEALRILSKKDKNFLKNYYVFKDLRSRGYIVKTGLKFGTEFRVYNKKQKHAAWLLIPILNKDIFKITEFISVNRIAHSTAKKILLALVENENSLTYYEVNWIKP